MDVIYGLIPMMLLFGFLVVIAFIWMAKKGYFDDMDGQANRILMDDEFETNPEKLNEISAAKDQDDAEASIESSKKDLKH